MNEDLGATLLFVALVLGCVIEWAWHRFRPVPPPKPFSLPEFLLDADCYVPEAIVQNVIWLGTEMIATITADSATWLDNTGRHQVNNLQSELQLGTTPDKAKWWRPITERWAETKTPISLAVLPTTIVLWEGLVPGACTIIGTRSRK